MSKPATADIFSLQGRRNRKSYFLYHVLFLGVLFAAGFFTATLDLLIEFNHGQSGDIPVGGTDQFAIFYILLALALMAFMISTLFVGAQRCRDFGWTGWAVFLTLVPYAGAIFWFALFFIPGDENENRYGPNPIN